MNASQPELNLSPAFSEPIRPRSRPIFDPVRLFVDMNLAARFWFFMFLLVTAVLLGERILLATRPPERVLMIDDAGNVINASLVDFKDATNFHMLHATWATQALLNRSPSAFDNPELLRLMFLPEALAKAKQHFTQEGAERESKEIHQKVEIGQLDRLETRGGLILFQIKGQVIRAGSFQNHPLLEGVPFQLFLKMLENPDMTQNGRFPLVVRDFEYATSH